MGAQGPHRWAAAGVEDALLDGGGISQAPDHPTEGIHFMDELAFGGATDGRIAGLPSDAIEIEAEQCSVQAQPGGGDRRFKTTRTRLALSWSTERQRLPIMKP